MYSQSNNPVQITFHYLDGHSESFTLHQEVIDAENSQEFQLEVRHLLRKEWWILHLPEQTVLINIANVTKVEVKPPMPQLKGEDVFPLAERMTALSRAR
ncbi:MAG: hypothetical protein IGR76_06870 [Synechococcales cyanobacterium T60_A2020_003]|nr:hypothetical protein [Synechococcales cyanobacterium T60_A2020_003]